MADFRIWGRVEHVGPHDFFVIASAVPEAATERVIVLTESALSLSDANAARDRLMMSAGEAVRARGDRVVDVEE